MPEKWIPWLYQYGVGGMIFFASLYLAMQTGALRAKLSADRWLLIWLVGGFFCLLLIHGVWIAAVN